MLITPIKTKKVAPGDSLDQILKDSLLELKENSVVIVTSKIVSITQGDIAPLTENKDELVEKEADKYFINLLWPKEQRLMLTIKDNILMFWAGIDESNASGYFVLSPKNPMLAAKRVWQFLRKTYQVKNLGVIIADSVCIPLRTGSISVGLGWCGFEPIKDYIGTKDIFGRVLQYTMVSFVDTLSIAAGVAMGEGSEQQPLAIVTDIPDIHFIDRTPTDEEKASVSYPADKDVTAPLLNAVQWEKGHKSSS